jgi:hypothetical protein
MLAIQYGVAVNIHAELPGVLAIDMVQQHRSHVRIFRRAGFGAVLVFDEIERHSFLQLWLGDK